MWCELELEMGVKINTDRYNMICTSVNVTMLVSSQYVVAQWLNGCRTEHKRMRGTSQLHWVKESLLVKYHKAAFVLLPFHQSGPNPPFFGSLGICYFDFWPLPCSWNKPWWPINNYCTRYLCHELKHPYASWVPGKWTTSEPLYSVLIFSCCHNNLPQLKTTAIYYLTVLVGRSPRTVGLRGLPAWIPLHWN